MGKYTLNGEEYYYNNGVWLTANFIHVPLALISQLEKIRLSSDQSYNDETNTEIEEESKANNYDEMIVFVRSDTKTLNLINKFEGVYNNKKYNRRIV